jgi:hypothetical protein
MSVCEEVPLFGILILSWGQWYSQNEVVSFAAMGNAQDHNFFLSEIIFHF